MDTFQLELEEAKLEKAREDYRFIRNYSFPYMYGNVRLTREQTQGICEAQQRARQRLEKAHRRVSEFQTLDLGGGG